MTLTHKINAADITAVTGSRSSGDPCHFFIKNKEIVLPPHLKIEIKLRKLYVF